MTRTALDRRDFLLMRIGRSEAVVLSCEQLYMRYVDATADGSASELFDGLARDLHSAKSVRLIKTSWLSDDDLKQRLDVVLDVFRASGGRVEH
jgi:hypothetical protein